MNSGVYTDSTSHVYAVGEVVSAATMNTYIQQDLAFLRAGMMLAASVGTGQTSASTTYVDLATVGPQVTVTTLTTAWVDLSAYISNTGGGSNQWMAVAVSGATTIPAADSNAITSGSPATYAYSLGGGVLVAGLTPGANTFTAKYRTVAGTGTWEYRNLRVTALGV